MSIHEIRLEQCKAKLNQQLKNHDIDFKTYKELLDRFTVYYKCGGLV